MEKVADLEGWEKVLPVRKVVYDRSAGKVRVVGGCKGKEFSKTFPVDQNLATVLEQAREFVKGQVQ